MSLLYWHCLHVAFVETSRTLNKFHPIHALSIMAVPVNIWEITIISFYNLIIIAPSWNLPTYFLHLPLTIRVGMLSYKLIATFLFVSCTHLTSLNDFPRISSPSIVVTFSLKCHSPFSRAFTSFPGAFVPGNTDLPVLSSFGPISLINSISQSNIVMQASSLSALPIRPFALK